MQDLTIEAAGKIPAGEYGTVSVKGTASALGFLSCQALRVYGTLSARGGLKCSGTASVDGVLVCGNVSCGDLRCNGTVKADGSIRCEKFLCTGLATSIGDIFTSGRCTISGGVRCKGKIHAGTLRISGGAACEKDMEAEELKVDGGIRCGSTVNAESITITGGGSAVEVGGSQIRILCEGGRSPSLFRGLLGRLRAASDREQDFLVKQSIEGDVLELERVRAPLVRGTDIVIGPGCSIDRVVCSGALEIDPSSTVKQVERS